MSEKVYDWDNCPNISLLDKRVVAWNEEYIKIKWAESVDLKALKGIIKKHNKKEIKIPTYWSREINQTAFIAGVNYEFEEFKKDVIEWAEKEAKKEK